MGKRNNNFTEKSLRDDERINAYMHGIMSKEEEDAFLKEKASDEEQRSKAVDLAYLTKAMKDVGQQRDKEVEEAMTTIGRQGIATIAGQTYEQSAGLHDFTPESRNGLKREVAYSTLKAEKQNKNAIEHQRKAETRAGGHRIIKILSAAACIAVICVVGVHYYDYHETSALPRMATL